MRNRTMLFLNWTKPIDDILNGLFTCNADWIAEQNNLPHRLRWDQWVLIIITIIKAQRYMTNCWLRCEQKPNPAFVSFVSFVVFCSDSVEYGTTYNACYFFSISLRFTATVAMRFRAMIYYWTDRVRFGALLIQNLRNESRESRKKKSQLHMFCVFALCVCIVECAHKKCR